MADINIQRKKSAPSPWILVLLALLAAAVAAYFFLRIDPAEEAAPANPTRLETTPADAVVPGSPTETEELPTTAANAADAADAADATEPVGNETGASLAVHAATNPAAPNYAVGGLRKLTSALVTLTDRDDLRDPAIIEQRDNLTSATSRLGESNTSLRPGFVAAAGLIRTMQQKSYPELETTANELVGLAGQMSGRSGTATEQQQIKQFLTQSASAVRAMSEPAQ